MKQSQRMQKIADINRIFESAAGTAYAHAQAKFDSQMEQLRQLEVYRDEYRQRLKERMASGITPSEMNDYRYFFASLDEAIRNQEKAIAKLRNRAESSRKEWMSKRRETEKMELVSTKFRNRERKEDDSREQKETDELSQLLYNFHNNRNAEKLI